MKNKKVDKWIPIVVVLVMAIVCAVAMGSAFAADASNTSNGNSGNSLNTVISSQQTVVNDNSSSLNNVSETTVDNMDNSTTGINNSSIEDSTNNATDTTPTTNTSTVTTNVIDAINLNNTIIKVTENTTYINSVFTNVQFIVNDANVKLAFNNCTFYNYDQTADITINHGTLDIQNSTFYKLDLGSKTANYAIVYYNNLVTILNNNFYNYATYGASSSSANKVLSGNTVSGSVINNNTFNINYNLSDMFRAYFYIRLSGLPASEIASNNHTNSYPSSAYTSVGTGLINSTLAQSSLGLDIIYALYNHRVSSNSSEDINKIITSDPNGVEAWINARVADNTIGKYVSQDFILSFLQKYYPEYYQQYVSGNLNLTTNGYTVWWYVIKTESDGFHVDGVVVPSDLLTLIQQQIAKIGSVNYVGYANTTSTTLTVSTNETINGTATITVFKDNVVYYTVTVNVKNGVSDSFTLPLSDEGVYNTSVNFTSDKYYYDVPVSYGYLTVLPYETVIANQSSTGKPDEKTNITTTIKVNTTGYTGLVVPDGNVTIVGPNGYN